MNMAVYSNVENGENKYVKMVRWLKMVVIGEMVENMFNNYLKILFQHVVITIWAAALQCYIIAAVKEYMHQ